MDYDTLSLQGGDYYITENEENAYRVETGTVLVFIVPYNGRKAGRRSFIYEAREGEVIPGFSFRDIEFCRWRFCLMAMERAEVSVMENAVTNVLRQRFCGKIGITDYDLEGYHNALVEKYRLNLVAEDSLIQRTSNNRENASKDMDRLIADAFRPERSRRGREKTRSPLYEALRFLCGKSRIPIVPYETVTESCGSDFTVEDVARLSHFACREVVLEPGWQKKDAGPMLVYTEDKTPCTCLWKGASYKLHDPEQNRFVPVTEARAKALLPKGYLVYRPLPPGKLGKKDILRFCLSRIRKRDILMFTALSVLLAWVGLMIPGVSRFFYDRMIPLGVPSAVFQVGSLLLSFLLAGLLFRVVQHLVRYRITEKTARDFQSAVYHRLFNLPESFFRAYDSAELAGRVMAAGHLVESVAAAALVSGASLLCLVTYFIRMITFSPPLALLGSAMMFFCGALYCALSFLAVRLEKDAVETEGRADSLLYQFLGGISKIRIAGVEDRALLEYFRPYVALRNTEGRAGRLLGLRDTLLLAMGGLFSLGIYGITVSLHPDITPGSFIAFATLFGSFCACFTHLLGSLTEIRRERLRIRRLLPVLQNCPETGDGKEAPGELSGEIEINKITFSYEKDAPKALDDISLTIRAGEYVGIVGPSGCGKSTLLRLLLGFEAPDSGKIYYDSRDIEILDKRELRKKMGVVLQNGSLVSGSIYENITVTAPRVSAEEVEAVVKAVGLDEDLRDMPMGLHTLVREDGEAVSGGQRQRILIARAMLSDPRILIFDEATSSLDNVSQKAVTRAIEEMHSTRIMIAHRLSTVLHCDRILVMDCGKIVEQGTYEELMHKKGLFYRLANRQIC